MSKNESRESSILVRYWYYYCGKSSRPKGETW